MGGPMDTGRPDTPTYVTDPNKMSGYDYSPLQAALMNQDASQGAMGREQSLASLQKAGVQGADQARAIINSQVNTLGQQNHDASNLALQAYNQKLGLMNAYNQNALTKYGIDAGNYNAELGSRAAGLNQGLSTAATVAALAL